MASRVEHVGEIVRRIRESRGISEEALARLCGRSRHTIHRLEMGDTERAANKRGLMTKIGDALSGPSIPIASRLLPTQRDLLAALTEADIARERAAQEYGWIDANSLRDRENQSSLSRLIDQLAREARPAMIVDPLLFIHAMNGMVLKVFEVDPEEWLYTWDMWHMIGAKMRPEAPPRARHVDDDHYIGTTAFFFQQPTCNRYLFTPQMGALLDRLDHDAETYDHPFVQRWNLATRFELSLTLTDMPRTLERLDGRLLQTKAALMDREVVHPIPEADVTFTLLGWDAADEEGRKMFADWRGGAPRQDLLFARDFDRQGDFHVNAWPEMARRSGRLA